MKQLWFFWPFFTLALLLPGINHADDLADSGELYTGKEFSDAFSNPEDDPNRQNVLLIGDSISIGYTVEVRKLLKGKADVFRISTNGRDTAYGLKHIDEWLSGHHWDVIHFNWGLWDICHRNPAANTVGHLDKIHGTLTTSPEDYAANLENIVRKLEQTGAQLIWCHTTPVPQGEPGRKFGDDMRYNAIAAAIMQAHAIPVNDLHEYALKKLPGIAKSPDNVHFTDEGYSYLARKVAAEIAERIDSQSEQ